MTGGCRRIRASKAAELARIIGSFGPQADIQPCPVISPKAAACSGSGYGLNRPVADSSLSRKRAGIADARPPTPAMTENDP